MTGIRVTLQTWGMPQRRMESATPKQGGEGGGGRDEQPGERRDQGVEAHVLRREDEDEDEEGAGGGVGPEQPGGEAAAADAVEVVAGEDGQRRDGGQDVAGELRSGEGEEEDGEDGPEDEELGEGVAGADVAEVALGVAAGLPFGDGDAGGVDQGAEAEDGPGHEGDQQDGEVVPEGLVVLVAVGGEALEIVLEEEELVEGRVAALDLDVPGQDHERGRGRCRGSRWCGGGRTTRGAGRGRGR